jgi:hypothetical protein
MAMNRSAVLLAFLAGACAVLHAVEARADVALESYVGPRPDDADKFVGPVLAALERRGFLVGPGAVGKRYESARSRSGLGADEAELAQIPSLVDQGWSAWLDGQYAVAVEKMQRVVDLVAKAPAAIAIDKTRRTLVQRAMIGLALSLRRLGEVDEAKRVMAEVVRSYRNSPPTRKLYGPEAMKLFAEVESSLAKVPGASLEVSAPPDVTLYVNEEAQTGSGNMTIGSLPPGTYRVLATRKDMVGRIYTVTLNAGQTGQVRIQWGLDSVIHTSPTWCGTAYPDLATRMKSEVVFGAEIGRAVSNTGIVALVGFEGERDRRWLVGKAIDQATGRLIPERSGRILLGSPEPSRSQLEELARRLLGAPGVVGVAPLEKPATSTAPAPVVEQQAPPVEREEAPRTGAASSWTATAAGATALGFSVALLAVDHDCTRRNEIGGCRAVRTTKLGGVAAASGGVLLAGATGYFWARRHPTPPEWLRRGRWVVVGTSLALVAAGVSLIVIDEPSYRILDERVYPAYEYRDTALAGGVITAVGAVGVGFSTYAFFARGRDGEVSLPSVEVSRHGASLGIAGRF